MKISVLIPAHNAARTIAESIASVLAQTVRPDEVIVLVDGATDDTLAVLDRFKDLIKLVVQENQGIANARNRLVRQSGGDILAFLDADDIWHPDYLATQAVAFRSYPQVVAGFTGHTRFSAEWHNRWPENRRHNEVHILDPLEFFTRYNKTTAVYGSMSYCAVARTALEKIGPEPFTTDLHAVEDSYLCYRLALLGSVAFSPAIRVAYRLTEGSLSVNRVRNLGRWVVAFDRLKDLYHQSGSPTLARRFDFYHASKQREFAKVLMGTGAVAPARYQLIRSMVNCRQPASLFKSAGLLALTFLPKTLQPRWSSGVRIVTGRRA